MHSTIESLDRLSDISNKIQKCYEQIKQYINCKNDDQTKQRNLIQINNQLSNKNIKGDNLEKLTSKEILIIYRDLLHNKTLHIEAIKFLDSLLKSPTITNRYIALHIPVIILRNL